MPADLAELVRLREALEGALRGHLDRATAQAVVDRYADRPWFPLAYVPRELHGRPLTIHRLAGCTHLPTHGGADTLESVSPGYTSTLLDWVGERISR